MFNREAIQRVQSLYSSGIQSDDSRLSSRHIYSVLCSNRAQLLSQEHKKNQKVSSFAYQTLPCVELEIVEIENCQILRSKYPLPAYLFGASKGIFRVSSMDGNTSITETSFEEKKFRSGNKYTAAKPQFYLRDRYLYIVGSLSFEKITVEAIFNDPLQAYLFPSPCLGNTLCKSYLDYEFPYEGDLENALFMMAAQELIEIFYKTREDKTNNGQDSRGEN